MNAKNIIRISGLLTFLISIILLYLSHKIVKTSGAGILDAQFLGRNTESVTALLTAYQGTKAPSIYASIQKIDILYPLVYGTFGAFILYQLFRPDWLKFSSVFMVLAAISDLAENFFLHRIVSIYPETNADWITLSSHLTRIKYGLIFVSVLFLIFGLKRLRKLNKDLVE